MHERISDQIASLPGMNKAQLKAMWAENFREPPPPALRKELMVPILAYRIQEREYGGLSNSARQKLRQIAKDQDAVKRPHSHLAASLEPETKFIRSWGGEMHEVIALGDRYEYRGRPFNSLSQIAREITGTRWSGPLFFGTKKKAA